MISQHREKQMVGLVVVAYIFLAILFSLGPIFEGPDEIEHYRFIRTLVQTHALPDPYSQPRAQYHQAPLYYVLSAPLMLLVHDDDFAQIDGRKNPYYPFEIGIPGNDNKNLYLHTRAEDFPYQGSGTAMAVHLLRLLSVALGAGTVLASYAIFRILWPDRPDRRLMALGLVAFMPQFLYLSGTINNDNLLFLLSTLSLLLLIRLRRDGPSLRLALLLGLVLGFILLTKVSAMVLAIPVGFALLLDRQSWRYAPLILGIVFVIAGWWYLRNLALYGDPTGVRVLLETWKGETIRAGAIALDIGLTRVPYSYQTFWARFGQGAVAVGQPIYVFFDVLAISSIAGLILSFRRIGMYAGIVLVFALTWVGALVYYASTAWSGNQGRYLLPALASWGAIVSWGLDRWTPHRVKLPAALSGTAFLAVVATVCVLGYFLPSYRPLPASPPPERALAFRYGDNAELIGISPAAPKVRPGEFTTITLYWRTLKPTDHSVQSYLHSVGGDVVKRDSLPATGNLLSTDWYPGETWAERYIVPIPADAPPQTVYPLVAGLFDPATQTNLAATANGQPVSPVVGRITVSGPEQPITPVYRFGDGIGLADPTLKQTGDQVQVCLRWTALAPVTTDYTVFVHLLGPDGRQVTQADSQPKGGQYPTSVWSPGETIDDCKTLTAPKLPTSGWKIALGLYDSSNGQRLPVQDNSGARLPDDTVILPPTTVP